MRTTTKIFFSLLIMCTFSCFGELSDESIADENFNDSWLFIKADSSNASQIEAKLLSGASYNGMTTVRLPHSAVNETEEHSGVYYYMKKFTIPSIMEGKMLSLRFEGGMNGAQVWINGKKSVSHSGGYSPFVANFTPKSGVNSVVIKLDNSVSKLSENAEFNLYEGLYRNVWLSAKDSLSVTNKEENSQRECGISISTTSIEGNTAKIKITADVRNAYSQDKKVTLKYSILDFKRKTIGRAKTVKTLEKQKSEYFSDTITLENITPWEIDNPSLYVLKTEVISGRKILDITETEFGIRDIKITPEGFFINGKQKKLTGVIRHQEYPYAGYAISEQAHWRDAYRIKRSGFDYVRICRYEQSPAFLKACDRYGIIVIDSITEEKFFKDYNKISISQPVESGEKALVQQVKNIIETHNDNFSKGAFADGDWVMFDYNKNNSKDIEYSGIMSISRMPKFSYYFFASQRDIDEDELQAFSEPICYIASYWQPKISKEVMVLSNCAEVELFVDGKSVGKQKPEINKSTQNLKHPYFLFNVSCQKPGTLKAIAFDKNGNPVSECTVKTPSTPKNLKLVLDESGTLASAFDVLLVHCYVLDANGTTVCDFSNEIEFSVNGTAKLISPSKIKAEAGVATALIQLGQSNNDFTVSAKCGMLSTVIDK